MTGHEPVNAGHRLECAEPGCGYWFAPDGPEPKGGWENWFRLRHTNERTTR